MSGLLGDGLRFGYLVASDPNRRCWKPGHVVGWRALLIELARHWLEDGTVVAIQARQAGMRAHCRAVARTELKTLGSPSTGWGLWLPAGRGRRRGGAGVAPATAGVDAIGSEPFSVAARPNALLVRLRLLAGKTSRHWHGRSWMPGPESSAQAYTRAGRAARRGGRTTPGKNQSQQTV